MFENNGIRHEIEIYYYCDGIFIMRICKAPLQGDYKGSSNASTANRIF